MSAHLWEVDHPYYCTEGCYYVDGMNFREVHAEWESWEDFIDEWGDADLDMNLLFRWDWEVPDPDDYEDEPVPGERVLLFMYGQRKAKPMSHAITVTREDEPIIREYLRVRAEHMRKLWEPLLDGLAS